METSPYAILRVAKLKSAGNVAGSLAHTYRTRATPNADPARAGANEHSHADPEGVAQALRARLPEKRRKDAVIGLEYFVGASPAWFDGKAAGDDAEYFAQALDWLRDKHGADNVVAWSIHRDEKTPHLVAYVVPLGQDGKLNAKAFTGGRATLSAMQTDFVKQVGQRHGLRRGIEGSKATHTTIKEYYAAVSGKPHKHWRLKPETVVPKVLKKRFLTTEVETPEQVADRISDDIQRLYAPVMKEASTARIQARRADEMARTAESATQALKTAQRAAKEATEARDKAQAELSAYKSVFEAGMTPDQQHELVAIAKRKQATNRERAEVERRERMTHEQRELEAQTKREQQAQAAREEAAFQRSLREVEAEEQPQRRERDRGPSLG